MLIIGGIFGVLTALGHFIVGNKSYLQPMMLASFDQVSKNTIYCGYHYVSVFLVLSSAALLLAGTNSHFMEEAEYLIKFIALNYLGFAIWQIVLSVLARNRTGIFKPIQWVFFMGIALLSWFGS